MGGHTPPEIDHSPRAGSSQSLALVQHEHDTGCERLRSACARAWAADGSRAGEGALAEQVLGQRVGAGQGRGARVMQASTAQRVLCRHARTCQRRCA